MPPFEDGKEYLNTKFSDFILEKGKFSEIHFEECIFENCTFDNNEFVKCVFAQCTFISSKLNMIKMINSRVTDCSFEGCKMVGIDWSEANTKMGLTLKAKDCDVSYNSFKEVDIKTSQFIDCKLHETDFTKAIAKKVSFVGCDLNKTVFSKTDLTEANFTKAVNYCFDVSDNQCKKAVFETPEVFNLLEVHGIIINE